MTALLALLALLGVATGDCAPFDVTYYSAEMYPGIVRDGSTSTIGALNRGEAIVAVDPDVIPLGSYVWVEDHGVARAADTGGGVRGRHVDWLVRTIWEALQAGRVSRTVCVLEGRG